MKHFSILLVFSLILHCFSFSQKCNPNTGQMGGSTTNSCHAYGDGATETYFPNSGAQVTATLGTAHTYYIKTSDVCACPSATNWLINAKNTPAISGQSGLLTIPVSTITPVVYENFKRGYRLTVINISPTSITLQLDCNGNNLDTGNPTAFFNLDYSCPQRANEVNLINIEKCTTTPPSCILSTTYTTCGTLNCVKFDISSGCTGCYCANIVFTDGTSVSESVLFSTNNTTFMFCFSKQIRVATLSKSSYCGCTATSSFAKNTSSAEEKTVEINLPTASIKQRIEVFPNPVFSKIYYKSPSDLHGYRIKIYSSDGKLILADDLNDKETSCKKIISGSYFYIISGPSNFSQKGGLIKSN